jgi:putative DNA primase/helicase
MAAERATGFEAVRAVMAAVEDIDMGGVPPLRDDDDPPDDRFEPAPPVGSPDTVEVTEDAVARAFTARYGQTRRFDHSRGRWLTWTGTLWAVDETGDAFNACRLLAREATLAAKGARLERARKAAFAAGVERLARHDPAHAVTAEFWDRDRWLLGTPGGTVDLRVGNLCHPDPEDGITRSTIVSPADHEACPRWLAFLEDATGADDNLVRFLRGWVGYSLTGSTREHALLFLWGPGGNGKSLFLSTVAYVLGGYATASSMATFTRGAENRHPTELASLAGARVVTASETDEGRAWDEARVKQLTGGDTVRARFMRQDEFQFTPQFKLTIAGNRAPSLRNVDDAMRRRLIVVPFTRRPSTPDPDLAEKLKAEAPGILRWAVNGCLDWQEFGLLRPSVVTDATAEYFEGQDVLGGWLAQDIEADPAGWASSRALFESWSAYARAAGEEPGTAKWLGEHLGRRGFERKKQWVAGNTSQAGRSVQGWQGLRIKGGVADGGF